VIIPSRQRTLPIALAAAAALGGAIAALRYHDLGLTLSHYDARGHLVVARRIVDSLTPGWQQVGAVWLPLPHVLNAIPVQIDTFYRTGASAVAISIAAFAIATGAIAWIVLQQTQSSLGALVAAAVFALNPNVVYLQATPMTEPLLLGLTTLSVALLLRWINSDRSGGLQTCTPDASTAGLKSRATSTSRAGSTTGWAFALACLTRYEAWPVTACALAAAVWARWRRGDSLTTALRRVMPIAFYPAVAITAFAIFSRVVIGEWLVASGFFVPDNNSLGQPVLAAAEIWWGTHQLSGYLTMVIAAAGLAGLFATGFVSRDRADQCIVLSLAATAVVPWFAFVEGHPFRIRYVVPLIAIEAIGAGVAVGFFNFFRSARLVAALLAALIVAYELRPLDANAPMVVEAQWDRPNVPARAHVTDCLRARYDGDTIMASMGSLGHYIQEASQDGFDVRDFLHEGNGDIWLEALHGPRPYAGWVLIEEKAEGGDMLAAIAREHPHFLDGYSRVCEGAGLALYRRQNRMLNVSR
jgi:hypothetical protein